MMITVQNIACFNFEGALRGMRNPLESWAKSDSVWQNGTYIVGPNDNDLALRLVRSGSDHAKFMRQILVCMDITAPLYWYKEFDTYKVATVANSTSTMHKLGSRNLTQADFSWDSITPFRQQYLEHINSLIAVWRNNKTEENFRALVQDLLDSYNQTRTVTLNYATLRNMYFARKSHKLAEWRSFCDTIRSLEHSEWIIAE